MGERHARLCMLLEADQHVVNCLQPHPYLSILATSGIDYDMKLWAPINDEPSFDEKFAEDLKKRNAVMLEETKDSYCTCGFYDQNAGMPQSDTQRVLQKTGRQFSQMTIRTTTAVSWIPINLWMRTKTQIAQEDVGVCSPEMCSNKHLSIRTRVMSTKENSWIEMRIGHYEPLRIHRPASMYQDSQNLNSQVSDNERNVKLLIKCRKFIKKILHSRIIIYIWNY